MIVRLLTEHHFEFLSLKEAAEARPSLHLSKYHIVGNLMPRLKCNAICVAATTQLHICVMEIVHIQVKSPNVETSLRLKIKCNDWLLADTCPQAANHFALF